MAGSPPSLPFQARIRLLSPGLETSEGWGLLYGPGESFRNPAHLALTTPEWICFQCRVGGACTGTEPTTMSNPIPNVLVQAIGLVLHQTGAETLHQTGTERKDHKA